MNTKNLLGTLAITSLVATSLAFAQDASVSASASASANAEATEGMPPPGGRPGIMGQLRNIRQDFKQGMEDKQIWKHGSTTMGIATPTPWKDMHGDMKNLRADMQGMMASITASLTAEQKTAISAKLGITIEELQAKIAAGTPLPQIIGNKITKEDMMKIMPMPLMASGTANHNYDQKPQKGFLNSFFGKLFGKRGDDQSGDMHSGMQNDMQGMMNASDSMQMDANASANADVHADGPVGGLRNFFKKLFNF